MAATRLKTVYVQTKNVRKYNNEQEYAGTNATPLICTGLLYQNPRFNARIFSAIEVGRKVTLHRWLLTQRFIKQAVVSSAPATREDYFASHWA